ncbi:MAG: IPT/TIG domain-containing protein, partial [Clostridia bacterium]|nr:IPT/TIG domain-containing protein [Clostridia bacterium]
IIQFRSPPGQGHFLPLTVSRYGMNSTSYIHYLPPTIHNIQIEYQLNTYLVTLEGDNFGVHSATIRIGNTNCAVLYQQHSSVSCILPLLFGGNHSTTITVNNQTSPKQIASLPLPSISRVTPLVVFSSNATIMLFGFYLPLLSEVKPVLSVGTVHGIECHMILSSHHQQPFIECPLPELPRGEWPISLLMNELNIKINPIYSVLSVICAEGSFATTGHFCQSCPSTAFCPTNATNPVARPGEWLLQSTNQSVNTIQCYNPSACLGGNQCQEGYHSLYCSQCSNGYTRKDTWSCVTCPSTIKSTLNAVWFVIVCVLLYISSIARFSSYTAWFTILIDSFQMIGLLTLFKSKAAISSIIKPFVVFCSSFILDMEVFHFDCLFPSLSEIQLFSLSLCVLGICFLLDGLIQIIQLLLSWLSKSDKDKHQHHLFSFRSGFTRLISLLYSLFLPILYHSFQSLSCNNEYFMTTYSVQFTGLAMCWSSQGVSLGGDYSIKSIGKYTNLIPSTIHLRYLWFVIIPSILALVITVGLLWKSYVQWKREKEIRLQMKDSSKQSSAARELVDNEIASNLHR